MDKSPIWDRVFEAVFDSGERGVSLKELPALVDADYQSCCNNVRTMRMAGMVQDQWIKPYCGGRPRKLVRIHPDFLREITLPPVLSGEYNGKHTDAHCQWTRNQLNMYRLICERSNYELTREDLARFMKLSYAEICRLLRPMVKAGVVIDMTPPYDGFDMRAKHLLKPSPYRRIEQLI